MSTHKQRLIFLFLLISFSLPVMAESAVELTKGIWPVDIKEIDGRNAKEKRLILKSKIDTAHRLNPGTVKIPIDSDTVVYIPEAAKLSALPTVYTHPELSEEVRKFYTQGVGNYAFWAFLIGVAAAVQ